MAIHTCRNNVVYSTIHFLANSYIISFEKIEEVYPTPTPAANTDAEPASPVKGRCVSRSISEYGSLSLTTCVFSQPGLGSVPATLQHLREEVGLAGQAWIDLGKPWHTLAGLWLRADAHLARTGRGDVEYDEARKSSLPGPLRDWVWSTLLRRDSQRPAESFGDEFTKYLKDLPWDTMTKDDAILEQIWCRAGKTGTIVLLVGLYWQAEYSGAGETWKNNMKLVDKIFRAILDAPAL